MNKKGCRVTNLAAKGYKSGGKVAKPKKKPGNKTKAMIDSGNRMAKMEAGAAKALRRSKKKKK